MTSANDSAELAAAVASDSLGGYLVGLAQSAGERSPGPARSVRTTEHKGHKVTVATSYDIVVDGTPVTARLHVGDSGLLYSPSLPYHRFSSALDAVRALISSYPDHFKGGA
ncbi:hypothetical protein ACIHFE_04790 [Streptomyces sp. NPDC052396]|uniref:hypothetical protein n=1 Tax=Streptomyces sp. NPDC052396 TaxID=3365689 RepID=UPI0037D8183B